MVIFVILVIFLCYFTFKDIFDIKVSIIFSKTKVVMSEISANSNYVMLTAQMTKVVSEHD